MTAPPLKAPPPPHAKQVPLASAPTVVRKAPPAHPCMTLDHAYACERGRRYGADLWMKVVTERKRAMDEAPDAKSKRIAEAFLAIAHVEAAMYRRAGELYRLLGADGGGPEAVFAELRK